MRYRDYWLHPEPGGTVEVGYSPYFAGGTQYRTRYSLICSADGVWHAVRWGVAPGLIASQAAETGRFYGAQGGHHTSDPTEARGPAVRAALVAGTISQDEQHALDEDARGLPAHLVELAASGAFDAVFEASAPRGYTPLRTRVTKMRSGDSGG